ncbi:hypothetical protein N0V86_002438 [Didymella sp. IMI 355093]|nr:hypothetical protein N0V86_002438 [Didymella sp. IMI 355093]
MRSYLLAASAPNRTQGQPHVVNSTEADGRHRSCVAHALHSIQRLLQVPSTDPSPDPGPHRVSKMVVPEAIVEATEKGMVGENLLCASIPSMEKATTTSSANKAGAEEKAEIMSRAEEAWKRPPKTAEELNGHVKIKGVDV